MPVVSSDQVEPRTLARPDHSISRRDIPESALKVLTRLHKSGYRSLMVGGSVRDLLLSIRPKDFDVGTDARPGQVRRVFRNSRVIGRRFRLVHVYFKAGIIEVATFRRTPDPEAQADGEMLITDDNVFGTPEEDAFRRDFTVNALFYDIADFSVIDYVGGIDDLEAQLIRAIGDPVVRFREDPVRMMRACELAGRLGFAIEAETQRGIHDCRHEIEKASPARVTEELGQILRCGHAGRALQWMLDLGLMEVMLPEAYAMVAAGERGLGEYGRILPALDRMVLAERHFSEISMLSALLLPSVLLRWHDVQGFEDRPIGPKALEELATEVIEPFFARFVLSKEKKQWVAQAIVAYHRMLEGRWSDAARVRFARRPSFQDALFLLELMNEATGSGTEALRTWRELKSESRPRRRPPRRRPRRRRRKPRRKGS
jgi:poly(A) polymerase